MAPRAKNLIQVRERLDQLVTRRLTGPLTDGDLAEFRELIELEVALLQQLAARDVGTDHDNSEIERDHRR